MTASRERSSLSLALPCLLAFLASSCLMGIELVAGRMMAREVGASLYSWTSVIGVILAGITAGNFAGGRIAFDANFDGEQILREAVEQVGQGRVGAFVLAEHARGERDDGRRPCARAIAPLDLMDVEEAR